MIILYTKPNCFFCKQAQKLLTALNIPFRTISNQEESNVRETETTKQVSPFAKIGEMVFNGYVELVAYVTNRAQTNGETMTKTFNRNDIVSQMNNRVVTVTFKKSNGTTRVLKGTLASSLVPSGERKNLQPNGGVNSDVVNCWDTEANGWRTFRVNSIVSVV